MPPGTALFFPTVNNECSTIPIIACASRSKQSTTSWSGAARRPHLPGETAISTSGVAKATDWLDRTVRVPTLHSLTLEQWIERYHTLKEKNRALLTGGIATGKPETEVLMGAEADRLRIASVNAGEYRPRSRSRDRAKKEALAVGAIHPKCWQGRSRDPPYLLPGDSNWTFAKTPLDCIVGSATAD